MGLQNPAALNEERWQVEIAFQRLDTNDFFVGDERDDAAGPFGRPPERSVDLFNLSVSYGLSARFNLQLNVPFSSSSGGVHQGTAESHRLYKVETEGFGDLSLEGEYWLSDPAKPTRLVGSVALGVKTATGSTRASGGQFSATGETDAPIDEAFQMGDGGWGVLIRAQGSARLGGPWFAYGSGFYLVSLDDRYEVVQRGAFRGVPDVYSARLGAAYQIPAHRELVVTLGGMVNGVAVRDLVGGGDLYWRRPGYEIFVEPGLTWTRDSHSVSASYPLRAYQEKKDSLLDRSLDRQVGAAFAAHLLKLSYARRF